MSSKISFIGHLTIDEIEYVDNVVRVSPGGTAFYSSLTSTQLGCNSRVYSVIGEDYPEEYLEILSANGVNIANIARRREAKTTRYRIIYRDGKREMFLLEKAPNIQVDEIEDHDAIYLGPVAQEITIEDIKKIIRNFKTAIDPQGILRSFDEKGKVTLVKSIDLSVLRKAWILRLSYEEAVILTGIVNPDIIVEKLLDAGVENIVLSMGSEGLITANKKLRYFIPPYSETNVVDPTGAGDVLGGAFLVELLSSGDFLWASCIGASAASISIEDYAANAILSNDFKKKVVARAYEVMDRVRRI